MHLNTSLPQPLTWMVGIALALHWLELSVPAAENPPVESLVSFQATTGPAGLNNTLTLGSDGFLYGTSESGGDRGFGTVYRVSKAGETSVLYSFAGGLDGMRPAGGVIEGKDGQLYGTAIFGGVGFLGTIFQLSKSGEIQIIHSFRGNPDSGMPQGELTEHPSGWLYGTTSGGQIDSGTVFRVNVRGDFETLYRFKGKEDGAAPQRVRLLLARDGFFYGTTLRKGAGDAGTIFRMSHEGTLTVIHSFQESTDGGRPWTGLMQTKEGRIFGTTIGGGSFSAGTIYTLDAAGSYQMVHAFNRGTEGGAPISDLIEGHSGTLYGMLSDAPRNKNGALFSISPSDFRVRTWGMPDEIGDLVAPGSGFTMDANGVFYGTTKSAGISNYGAVIRFHPEDVGPKPLRISFLQHTGNHFQFQFPTEIGVPYSVLSTSALEPTAWTIVTNVLGNGSDALIEQATNGRKMAFFRIQTP